MGLIYLEDLVAGEVHELGEHRISREAIVDFAAHWDPQPFHLDEEAGRASIYGGLIASGWHTVVIFMRLFADGLLNRAQAMGSPGVDELRWHRPVRPGDLLRGRVEVLEVRPSRSRPDRGMARLRSVVVNQEGDEVLSFIANVIFGRRPGGATAQA
jgi:acyl dehydratase